jgi:hypothetical protein
MNQNSADSGIRNRFTQVGYCSNELGLKAKICDVSPFLLLLGNSQHLSKVPRDIDFTEFKTLDAVDLPAAVNTLCNENLTDKFIQSYNHVRSLRNKIAHLGKIDKAFDPHDLLRILVFQYTELWKGRMWLKDRLEYASKTRDAYFHDYRYLSSEMTVMAELPSTFAVLTNSEFVQLFKHSKKTRRYLCHNCIYMAQTKFFDPDIVACKTAFLEKEGLHLNCAMCGGTFKVKKLKCNSAGCKGNIIGDNDDEFTRKCHSCGEYREAWP